MKTLKDLMADISLVLEPTEIDPMWGKSHVAFTVEGQRFACEGDMFAKISKEWYRSGIDTPTHEQMIEGALEWCLDFVQNDGTIYFGNFS